MTCAQRLLRHPVSTRLTVVALLLILGVGCSVDESIPPPTCVGGGSHLIVAQSVPGANQVPCLEALPEGWSVTSVSVNQDRTIITFDSDRAGSNAAKLRLDPSCDVGGAVSSASEFDAAERFDLIEQLAPGFRASRFYRFDGGCVTWLFDFDEDASATEAVAVGDSLSLIPRQDLSDALRDSFVDEEL